MINEDLKKAVRDYWEEEPCGSWAATSRKYTPDYFQEIEEYRYRMEGFIHQFAQFTRFRSKKVLEVGIGAGTDHVQFARAGAELFGVDITDEAIDMANKRLAMEGLFSKITRADAENLPFESNFFDLVYSWGVLHHTPDTDKSLAEVYRVCKPNGKVCIMLYHRNSLVALQLWLLHGLFKLKPWRSLREVIYHHMESLGTKAYSLREARKMFKAFSRVSVTPILTPYDVDRIPKSIARYIPQTWGWFLVIEAIK